MSNRSTESTPSAQSGAVGTTTDMTATDVTATDMTPIDGESTGTVTAAALASCWSRLRAQQPLVQCVTNIVVAPFSANVLLAAGAAPAMVDNVHEAADFAAVANGVLINLGTPYEDTVAAMRSAARAATEAGTPWVLDPVAAGGMAWRTGIAQELLTEAPPSILRGNASEIVGLSGGPGGRGVDSTAQTHDAEQAARDMALAHGCVVAVSGQVDLITDGEQTIQLDHGHEWMTRVTGVGCALGALMAACAAGTEDPLVAAATATAALTLAAEPAACTSGGPGSFAVALLDELAALEPATIRQDVRLR